MMLVTQTGAAENSEGDDDNNNKETRSYIPTLQPHGRCPFLLSVYVRIFLFPFLSIIAVLTKTLETKRISA